MKTRMNGNISFSYGLNQYASKLPEAYHHLDEQQSLSISLNIPLFDWGISSNQRKIADNKLKSTVIEINNSVIEVENSIQKNVFSYNMTHKNYVMAESRLKLSREQYKLATIRFKAGAISVYELSQAYDAQQSAIAAFADAISQVFTQYYAIRHIALYDFKKNKTLADIFNKN